MSYIKIEDRYIGRGKPTYIIAEMSANHNQDLKIAIKTIKAISESGADAVKIQTYTADTMTLDIKTGDFEIKD